MSIIFEIIFEIILEGSIELVGNKKVPMTIRILSAVFLSGLYCLLMVGIIALGVKLSGENMAMSVFLFLLALFLAIGAVVLLRKRYRKYKETKNQAPLN